MNKHDLITYGTICAIISAEHSTWFYKACNKGYAYMVDQIAAVSIKIFNEQKKIESVKDFDWMDWIERSRKDCTAWDDYIMARGKEELEKLLV